MNEMNNTPQKELLGEDSDGGKIVLTTGQQGGVVWRDGEREGGPAALKSTGRRTPPESVDAQSEEAWKRILDRVDSVVGGSFFVFYSSMESRRGSFDLAAALCRCKAGLRIWVPRM